MQRDKLGRIMSKTESVLGVSNAYEYTYDLVGRFHLFDTGQDFTQANMSGIIKTQNAWIEGDKFFINGSVLMEKISSIGHPFRVDGDVTLRNIIIPNALGYDYEITGSSILTDVTFYKSDGNAPFKWIMGSKGISSAFCAKFYPVKNVSGVIIGYATTRAVAGDEGTYGCRSLQDGSSNRYSEVDQYGGG